MHIRDLPFSTGKFLAVSTTFIQGVCLCAYFMLSKQKCCFYIYSYTVCLHAHSIGWHLCIQYIHNKFELKFKYEQLLSKVKYHSFLCGSLADGMKSKGTFEAETKEPKIIWKSTELTRLLSAS